MKKLSIIAVSVICAIATMADSKASDKADKEAKLAARKERMMQATGGLVEKPGVGKIAVVNAQHKVSEDAITNIVAKLVFQTHFNVELVRGDFPMYTPPPGFRAAVVIGADENLPLSLVASENLWGFVNVAKIGDKNVESRFTKEFIRVTTLAFGASLSQFVGSPLCSTDGVNMLDKHVTENYTFDCQQMILKNLSNLGMRPSTKTTYKKACQEGWAPQPTNQYQKVIWDQVHAIPDRPITIEFDPKKDK